MNRQRRRRIVGVVLIAIAIILIYVQSQTQVIDTSKTSPPTPTPTAPKTEEPPVPVLPTPTGRALAIDLLGSLAVKGRAPKTGYARTQFGDGWALIGNCDTRNLILNRDMTNVIVNSNCKVMKGELQDPYTGTLIIFERGPSTSDVVQIDHVVALSNAWQTGAQLLTVQQRSDLANDPLELLAVQGQANQDKADGDAATWLPPYKAFRCQYVARQIAVKAKYSLWVTQAEKDAMARVLSTCPDQAAPRVKS